MRILDVGCGRGGFAKGVLVKNDATVVGMDITLSFLREAAEISPSNCSFVLASASSWCFKKGSFEEIHCHHILEHVEDLDGALDGIAWSLAPGGKLYLSSPYPLLEGILGNLMDDYIGENMHRRIIRIGDLIEKLGSRGIRVTRVSKRKFFDAVMLLIRFIRGMPFEAQSGLFDREDVLTRYLHIVSRWSFLNPEEIDFGKKKYLKGVPILAKAMERVFRHLFPHEYYMEAVRI